MQLFINALTGITYTIIVDLKTDTLDSLKRKIQAAGGPPIFQQRLILRGEEITSDTRLDNTDIEGIECIRLVTKPLSQIALKEDRSKYKIVWEIRYLSNKELDPLGTPLRGLYIADTPAQVFEAYKTRMKSASPNQKTYIVASAVHEDDFKKLRSYDTNTITDHVGLKTYVLEEDKDIDFISPLFIATRSDKLETLAITAHADGAHNDPLFRQAVANFNALNIPAAQGHIRPFAVLCDAVEQEIHFEIESEINLNQLRAVHNTLTELAHQLTKHLTSNSKDPFEYIPQVAPDNTYLATIIHYFNSPELTLQNELTLDMKQEAQEAVLQAVQNKMRDLEIKINFLDPAQQRLHTAAGIHSALSKPAAALPKTHLAHNFMDDDHQSNKPTIILRAEGTLLTNFPQNGGISRQRGLIIDQKGMNDFLTNILETHNVTIISKHNHQQTVETVLRYLLNEEFYHKITIYSNIQQDETIIPTLHTKLLSEGILPSEITFISTDPTELGHLEIKNNNYTTLLIPETKTPPPSKSISELLNKLKTPPTELPAIRADAAAAPSAPSAPAPTASTAEQTTKDFTAADDGAAAAKDPKKPWVMVFDVSNTLQMLSSSDDNGRGMKNMMLITPADNPYEPTTYSVLNGGMETANLIKNAQELGCLIYLCTGNIGTEFDAPQDRTLQFLKSYDIELPPQNYRTSENRDDGQGSKIPALDQIMEETGADKNHLYFFDDSQIHVTNAVLDGFTNVRHVVSPEILQKGILEVISKLQEEQGIPTPLAPPAEIVESTDEEISVRNCHIDLERYLNTEFDALAPELKKQLAKQYNESDVNVKEDYNNAPLYSRAQLLYHCKDSGLLQGYMFLTKSWKNANKETRKTLLKKLVETHWGRETRPIQSIQETRIPDDAAAAAPITEATGKKLFVFDFDGTLPKGHYLHCGVKEKTEFRNPDTMKALILHLHNQGHTIAICSHNKNKRLIRAALNMLLDTDDSSTIISDDNLDHEKTRGNYGHNISKNDRLKALAEKNGISDLENLVFIDDNSQKFQEALDIGCTAIHADPKISDLPAAIAAKLTDTWPEVFPTTELKPIVHPPVNATQSNLFPGSIRAFFKPPSKPASAPGNH